MTVLHKNLTGTELHEPKGVATAPIGNVYVSDGAGSGTWQKSTANIVNITDAGSYYVGTQVEAALQEIGLLSNTYGLLYIEANTTSETATGSPTWDTWTTGWAAGISNQMTLSAGAGSITITDTGKYEVAVSFSFYQSAAAAADWTFALSNNGVQITGMKSRLTMSGTDEQNLTIHSLLSLTAADVITLDYIRNSGATNPIVNYAQFSAKRIA